jgi:hypothetical protein
MSFAMASADGEGAMLGDAALVVAGLGVDTAVGAALGDAADEQAAIAIASAGTRRTMYRFMVDDIPSGFGLLCRAARRCPRSI